MTVFDTLNKSDIRQIQHYLREHEFDVGRAGVDGLKGRDTNSALEKFQGSSVYDEATLEKIFSECHSDFDRNLSYGMRGDDVTSLREFLEKEGHYHGSKDNIFGPRMREAVKAYQLKHGLYPTGELDDFTAFHISCRRSDLADRPAAPSSQVVSQPSPPAGSSSVAASDGSLPDESSAAAQAPVKPVTHHTAPETHAAESPICNILGRSLNASSSFYRDDTRVLNTQLIDLGYLDPADVSSTRPVFNRATETALKNWQRDHGLKPTGILDFKTNVALFGAEHHQDFIAYDIDRRTDEASFSQSYAQLTSSSHKPVSHDKKTIMLDAGHGFYRTAQGNRINDPGAIRTFDGENVSEAFLNQKLTAYLTIELERYGYDVQTPLDDDADGVLDSRFAARGGAASGDVHGYYSIHFDARKTAGTDVYTHSRDPDSQAAASLIAESIGGDTRLKTLTKAPIDPVYLKNLAPDADVALFEVGSFDAEGKELMSDAYLQHKARQIARAIYEKDQAQRTTSYA